MKTLNPDRIRIWNQWIQIRNTATWRCWLLLLIHRFGLQLYPNIFIAFKRESFLLRANLPCSRWRPVPPWGRQRRTRECRRPRRRPPQGPGTRRSSLVSAAAARPVRAGSGIWQMKCNFFVYPYNEHLFIFTVNIESGLRIRIRSGFNRVSESTKVEKNFKSSFTEVLDGLYWELKAFPVIWTFFMEA